jgi:excisionase family DNA binding protein
VTDRLLTLLEFAKYICTSRKTARRIVERGEIPSFRIGASLRVRLSDVERFIEDRRIERVAEASGLKSLVARAVQRARDRRSQ